MLPIEREFAVAIWVLYSIDCVHWLKPGESALVRRWGAGWKLQEHREEAFTLLGRMPVVVNPLDLRPGLVILRSGLGGAADAREAGARVKKQLKGTGVLTAVAYIAAVNLLVLVPALLLKGWFEFLWKIPVALLVWTHVLLVSEVVFRAKEWRRAEPGKFWPEFVAIALNPVGALRAGDLLSKRITPAEEKKM